MKRILVSLSIAVISLAAGGILSAFAVGHWRLYPAASEIYGLETDGVRLSFSFMRSGWGPFFKADNLVWVDCWDWKNNKPKLHYEYHRENWQFADIFYGGEKAVMAKIGPGRLFVYHKFPPQAGEVRAAAGDFVSVSPDGGFFADAGEEGFYRLNADGSIAKKYPLKVGSDGRIVAVSDDASHALIADYSTDYPRQALYLYDFSADKLVKIKSGDGPIVELTWSSTFSLEKGKIVVHLRQYGGQLPHDIVVKLPSGVL